MKIQVTVIVSSNTKIKNLLNLFIDNFFSEFSMALLLLK